MRTIFIWDLLNLSLLHLLKIFSAGMRRSILIPKSVSFNAGYDNRLMVHAIRAGFVGFTLISSSK